MSTKKSYYYPLTIIGILFFVFGFLTWVNGILIPYFQICLDLTNFQASLVAFCAYIAYFVMALPSAYILKFTGYRKGMVLGLVIMAVGTILFIPAAYTRTYAIFLTGLFITGSGLALLQTAANPYVAIIGPIESTAQRIGFMGLANKTAGIIALALLGSIFLFNADEIIDKVSKAGGGERAAILNEYALKIVNPYIVITIVLLLLAVMIYFSKMPEINETKKEEGDIVKEIRPRSSIFHYPHLILGVLGLFFAAACEVIPIDGMIIYSRALGIPIEEARHFSTYTLYAMLGGYLASTILIPKYLSQNRALQFCAIAGIVLTLGAYFSSGYASIIFLMLMGFGAAMLWGTIWGLSLRELGIHTKKGSAMLLMSVIGGGIFPLIFGGLIDRNPTYPQNAILLLIPCYLVLLFFASRGYRLQSWKRETQSKLREA
ncbi:MAG TPA: sugar MFS transporter [Chitinophagaceae bacterium]